MRVIFDGECPHYLTAKDLVLSVIGALRVDGATYCTLQFDGPAVEAMSIAERMTLCNMAIEAGAKSGIIEPDQSTLDFVRARTDRSFDVVHGDADAGYRSEHRFDVERLAPQVALPHSPDNTVDVNDVEKTPIDRCYIGSCTGGKTEDFIRAAEILDGRKVVVDTYCVPATTHVVADLETIRRGGRTLREILEASGAFVGPPSCAACLGGPPDTFGRLNGSEKCISTTNRNFPGRMGSRDSQVFLASPYTVAASAVSGHIADPRNYLQEILR
jgi:3-isopropylmalate/(R)-2-methylmalate dehydratase large subunit